MKRLQSPGIAHLDQVGLGCPVGDHDVDPELEALEEACPALRRCATTSLRHDGRGGGGQDTMRKTGRNTEIDGILE